MNIETGETFGMMEELSTWHDEWTLTGEDLIIVEGLCFLKQVQNVANPPATVGEFGTWHHVNDGRRINRGKRNE